MFYDFILQLLPQPTFIVFVSTFAGALAGEAYRETSDGVPYTFSIFIAKFFASWMVGFAATLLVKGFVNVGRNELLIALSIIFGFMGHKETILVAKNIIESKFLKMDSKDKEKKDD